MKNLELDLKNLIIKELPNAKVFIQCISEDGQKYEAIVIDKSFETLTLVKQHQKIMLLLQKQFKEALHALSLKTYTPDNWEKNKDKFTTL